MSKFVISAWIIPKSFSDSKPLFSIWTLENSPLAIFLMKETLFSVSISILIREV
jgi:hypothetical protein